MSTLAADLAGILGAVRRPGDFHASGRVEIFAPRIEVDGVGPIALPLLPAQAAQLIAAAERAPHGRGSETILDMAVRRTWQIGADRIRIAGRHWPSALDEIVLRAAAGLGVSGPVAAELYKLLIYDEGSFFVGHRDTEKSPGMFATLVLALPSVSSAGELVVRHKGREARLDLACEEPSEIAYAAFYADCVHEVLPVTSGFRATLVYNLVRRGRGASPKPPDYEGETSRTVALLRRWAGNSGVPPGTRLGAGPDGEPTKLIYPLEHAYTPAELDFAALKGADAAAAGLLAAAAPRAGCDLHLALITIEESGAAEYTGSGRGRWREPDLEAGEVHDRYEALGDWRRADGQVSTMGELPILEDELCPPGALDDMAPDEEHFHEATGNEGASFDRTYRRAALVLWPGAQLLAVFNQAGLAVTLPYLADLVGRLGNGGADPDLALRRQALELAGHMLASWPESTGYARDTKPSDAGEMLSLLSRLGDRNGADRLLAMLIAGNGHGKADNAAILGALDLFSPDKAAQRLAAIVAAGAAAAPAACSALLAGAARARFASAPAKLSEAAAILVGALPGKQPSPPTDRFGWPLKVSIDADCIVDLVGLLDVLNSALAESAARHLLAWPGHFGLDAVLVPAIRRLVEAGADADGAALGILHRACLDHLKDRIAQSLDAPKDWTRPSGIGCKCEHCAALGRFLADPERPSWSLKAAEQVRGHVESTIRHARSDVDTKTDRSGRPYSLVCVKNRASYERRVAQRKSDLDNLEALTR